MRNGKLKDRILYEDDAILVCHKPAGTAVQNARIGTMDMESALKNYLSEQQPGQVPYLGIVHRLDQPVEGVMVFAKTKKAAAALCTQMTSGEWSKEYLAVTDGSSKNTTGTLIDYLKKNGRNNLSSAVTPQTPGAKRAELSYEVLEKVNDSRTKSGKRRLLRIVLKTGRHHQIRVQMAHAGMPLLGDRKYYPEDPSGLQLGLCSCKIAFRHPLNNKKTEFCLLPEGDAFQGFLALCRKE